LDVPYAPPASAPIQVAVGECTHSNNRIADFFQSKVKAQTAAIKAKKRAHHASSGNAANPVDFAILSDPAREFRPGAIVMFDAPLDAKPYGRGTTRLAIGPHFCTSFATRLATACGVIGSARMASSASRRFSSGSAQASFTA
jgi:hypothetical protein